MTQAGTGQQQVAAGGESRVRAEGQGVAGPVGGWVGATGLGQLRPGPEHFCRRRSDGAYGRQRCIGPVGGGAGRVRRGTHFRAQARLAGASRAWVGATRLGRGREQAGAARGGSPQGGSPPSWGLGGAGVAGRVAPRQLGAGAARAPRGSCAMRSDPVTESRPGLVGRWGGSDEGDGGLQPGEAARAGGLGAAACVRRSARATCNEKAKSATAGHVRRRRFGGSHSSAN